VREFDHSDQTSGNLKMRGTASPLLNTYFHRVHRDNSTFSYLQASCILISKLTSASHCRMVRLKKWRKLYGTGASETKINGGIRCK